MLRAGDLLRDQVVFRPDRAAAEPVVSVVLPTYRRFRSGRLRRAVDSVLGQSLQALELIVVDDGSTDGTEDYLRALQRADSRVVYVRHDLNCGLPAVRVNEGIELASAPYLAFQFDDDEWEADALAVLIARAREQAGLAVVLGYAGLILPSGKVVRFPDREVNATTLAAGNRLANNSVLVPRELFERYGMYDPHVGMRRLCDWDLWQRLASRVPFLRVEADVSRVHTQSDESSLELTVASDYALTRFLAAAPRDELLRPSRWREYQVDSVERDGFELGSGYRLRLQRDHIEPHRRRVLHAFPHLATPPAAAAGRVMIHAADTFDRSLERGPEPYTQLCRQRATYAAHYLPLERMQEGWPGDSDLLLIDRSSSNSALRRVEEALAAGIPVAAYFDGDFRRLEDHGPPWARRLPATPDTDRLASQLAQADAVWTTSEALARVVLPYNRRILPHGGALREEWLPARLRPRGSGGPVRIGFCGGGERGAAAMLHGVERLLREIPESVEFEFWGAALDFPVLDAAVRVRPPSSSYQQLIAEVHGAQLDLLISPCGGAAADSYHLAAAAGALGIFSGVPAGDAAGGGLTCLAIADTPEDWVEAMRAGLGMPAERFDRMRRAMIEHVRLELTDSARLHLHEAACRATEFHGLTRGRRGLDGRPVIAFLAPSAAADLRATMALAESYGVRAVAIEWRPGELPAELSPPQPPIAVVCGAGDAAVDAECAARQIARVRFSGARCPQAQQRFDDGLRRLLAGTAALPAEDTGSSPAVQVHRRGDGHALGQAANMLVDASAAMELPEIVAQAMAGGVLVVSNSPACAALLVDEVTAVLFAGEEDADIQAAVQRALGFDAEQRVRITRNAYRLARGEFHPERGISDFFAACNQALEASASDGAREPAAPAAEAARQATEIADLLAERDGLREEVERWRRRLSTIERTRTWRVRERLLDLKPRLGAEAGFAPAFGPCVIGATGGSGTRVVANIAMRAGMFMGMRRNPFEDAVEIGLFLNRYLQPYLAQQPAGIERPLLRAMSRDLDETLQSHRQGIDSAERRYGWKEPRSIYLLPFLNRRFPHLRFLHLVRDGRDMALSANQNQLQQYGELMLTAEERERSQPARAIALWNHVNLRAADFGEQELRERYLRVRFEDLCADAPRTVARLLEFFELSGDAAAIAAAEVKPPDTVERWRRQPAELIAELELAGAPALRRFGYLPRS